MSGSVILLLRLRLAKRRGKERGGGGDSSLMRRKDFLAENEERFGFREILEKRDE